MSYDKAYAAAYYLANRERLLARSRERAGALQMRTQVRRAWLGKIKTSRGCVDCGYDWHAEALQFDHRDPSKKLFSIGQGLLRKMETLLAEIEKCDIRCANCHAVRTQKLGHSKLRKVA